MAWIIGAQDNFFINLIHGPKFDTLQSQGKTKALLNLKSYSYPH